MTAVVVDQDAFDVLVEKAVMWAVLVEDNSKEVVADLVTVYAHCLGETSGRVIAGHIVEYDPHPCWQRALRALSRRD